MELWVSVECMYTCYRFSSILPRFLEVWCLTRLAIVGYVSPGHTLMLMSASLSPVLKHPFTISEACLFLSACPVSLETIYLVLSFRMFVKIPSFFIVSKVLSLPSILYFLKSLPQIK